MAFLPGISNFLKGGQNPMDKARPYLNDIPRFGREGYQPYINQGQEAQQGLPDYAQMAQDPSAFFNQVASQYKPSQAYQNRFEQANRMAESTAAAGGYTGTMDDQRGRSEMVNKLMGEDFQEFLSQILGIQGVGAEGLEKQVGRGYNASSSLADYLGQANQNLASGEFSGKQQQTGNKFNFINALLGTGAQAYGANQYNQAAQAGGGGGGGKDMQAIMAMMKMFMGG